MMPLSFSLIKSKPNTNQTFWRHTKQMLAGKLEELLGLYCLFFFLVWEMGLVMIIKCNCSTTICEWIILVCKVVW